jgi:quercetin dioxygenase-like cupin family protein
MLVYRATDPAPAAQAPQASTSKVVVDPVLVVPEHQVLIFNVSFQPGARTHWHTHSVGQVLHVTHGQGRVCLRGESPRPMSAGDVVHIGPGEVHWHGACPETSMVHLAITMGDEGVRLDPVTDAEYEGPG